MNTNRYFKMIFALTWEFLRRGVWWFLGGMFGTLLFRTFMIHQFTKSYLSPQDLMDPAKSPIGTYFLVLMSAMVHGAFVVHVMEDPVKSRGGLPRRFATLPLPDWFIPVFSMVLAMLTMGTLITLTEILSFQLTGFMAPLWISSFTTMVCLAALMAVLWSLADWPQTRILAGFLVVAPFIIFLKNRLGFNLSYDSLPGFNGELRLSLQDHLLLTCSILLSMILSILGYRAHRLEESILKNPFASPKKERVKRKRDITNFKQPAEYRSAWMAQYSFECRRKAWIHPVVVAFFLCLVVGVVIYAEGISGDLFGAVFVASYTSIAFASLGVGALMARMGQRQDAMSLDPFLATRPLDDRSLASATMAAAGTGLIASLLLSCALSLVLAIIAITTGRGDIISDGLKPISFIADTSSPLWAMFIMYSFGTFYGWVVMNLLMVAALHGRKAVGVAIISGTIILYIIIPLLYKIDDSILPNVIDAKTGFLLLLLLPFIVEIALIGMAIRKKLISKSLQLAIITSLAGFTAITFAAVVPGELIGRDSAAFALLALWLALNPIAGAPVALSYNRHR